jgi:competence protein ComEA
LVIALLSFTVFSLIIYEGKMMSTIRSIITACLTLGILLTANAYAADIQSTTTEKSHSSQQMVKSDTSVVNINTADAKTLMTLKGIGAKKAEVIVAYRTKNGNFATVDDLSKVKGIGEKGLARLIKNNPDRIVIK